MAAWSRWDILRVAFLGVGVGLLWNYGGQKKVDQPPPGINSLQAYKGVASHLGRLKMDGYGSAMWIARYCSSKKLHCFIDMTAKPSTCRFDEPAARAMMASNIDEARAIAVERCDRYQWRDSETLVIFEPRGSRRGTLERRIPAYDSGVPRTAEAVLFELLTLGGLRQGDWQFGGMRGQPGPSVRVRTSAGTLKNALEEAARNYPKSVWWVVDDHNGYLWDVSRWN